MAARNEEKFFKGLKTMQINTKNANRNKEDQSGISIVDKNLEKVESLFDNDQPFLRFLVSYSIKIYQGI